MQIWIIFNYNLYESKRHFALHLGEAMRRAGIEVRMIDWMKEPNPTPAKSPPDLCCSFNRVIPDKEGKFFWDGKRLPFLSILVDPALYDLNLTKSPFSYLSCVDRADLEFLDRVPFKRAFFWPHAVERELTAAPEQERPYDVTFLGSSYDPEGLRTAWQEKYPTEMQRKIEEAIEITLTEPLTPFWEAVRRVRVDAQDFLKICTLVDNYVRGVDRLELIRAVAKIPSIKVHVFGGSCWREETPIMGWSHYLGGNVLVHPAISYPEALEVMKQSKICLNSSPFFKKGSHERILAGLACGSFVVTTESEWVREQFLDGEELLLYRPKQWEAIQDKVAYFLGNETARKEAAAKGRLKVMQHHTWDNRVEELIQFWKSVRSPK